MRRILAVLAGMAMTATPALAQPLDAEAIAEVLRQRIAGDLQGVGIVVGLTGLDGRVVVAEGTLGVDDTALVDGETLFEIGSVTKAITGLLLAEAVLRGEVSLDDSALGLLSEPIEPADPALGEIALRDLAMQSSSLPRLPDNFDPSDPADPFADYDVEDLRAFLGSYTLPRPIGESYEYSNLGMGLLGYALAEAHGIDYETLVTTRLLGPLGLDSTGFAPDGVLAEGHDAALTPVPHWSFGVLAGAGALRSNAEDMLDFLEILMDEDGPIAEAVALSTEPYFAAGEGLDIGLAWHITPFGDGDRMVWHNGITGGFNAFIGYLDGARIGVVVLANTASTTGIDDIALHVLDAQFPLTPQPEQREAVEVDPAVFEGLAGVYELNPEFRITVFTEDGRLFAEATGQDAYEVFPLSETEYFYRVVEAELAFETDSEGMANVLILKQNGLEQRAERVTEAAP